MFIFAHEVKQLIFFIMTKIGYRISFEVDSSTNEREIVVVHNAVLALRMLAFATREMYFPVLTTFEYEIDDNENI